jgi:hypothetical protein
MVRCGKIRRPSSFEARKRWMNLKRDRNGSMPFTKTIKDSIGKRQPVANLQKFEGKSNRSHQTLDVGQPVSVLTMITCR